MSDAKGLTVIEQREIPFNEDLVTAVVVEDGTVFVPLRPICDRLGVAWNGQYERLKRDEVMASEAMSVRVTRTDIEPNSRQPRESEMICLPLEMLNGWLFGISVKRVKEEVKPILVRYKKDCFRVLFEAFGQNMVTSAPSPIYDELLARKNPSALAFQQAMAVANLAKQQMLIEARLISAEDHLGDLENRVQIIEADRGDDSRYLTNAEATQIAQAVKQIALELGKRTRRNEFGGVYGELYRRFEIPSYKQLPRAQFDEAMTFLRGWWESLTDSAESPF